MPDPLLTPKTWTTEPIFAALSDRCAPPPVICVYNVQGAYVIAVTPGATEIDLQHARYVLAGSELHTALQAHLDVTRFDQAYSELGWKDTAQSRILVAELEAKYPLLQEPGWHGRKVDALRAYADGLACAALAKVAGESDGADNA